MSEEVSKIDTKGVFPRLLRMLRPHYRAIGFGLLLLILSGPCEIFPAQVWKFVVDDIVLNKKNESPILHHWFSLHDRIAGRMNLLVASIVWLFVIYLIGEVLQTIQQNLMNRVAQRFTFNLRNRVYHKLQSQSLGYLQRQRTGDLLSRAIGDVDEIQTFIVNGIDVIIGEEFVWCITVAIAMWMDWRVASIALAPLFLVYVLLKIFNKLIKPIYTAVRERAGDIATRLQENLSGVVVIKIFNREKQEAGRFEAATKAYYDQQIQAINARYTFFPITRVVGFLSNVAMIGAGGYFIIKDGSFTLGSLLAFRAYWWRLFGPVQTLARVNDMVQRALAAAKRGFEILDAPDELPDAPHAIVLERVRGTMELRDVTFRYPTELGKPRPIVLENGSLQVHPGKTVALCGPSGSGKSTILNLLVRFYDPAAGQVLLDGHDLREIRRDGLRRHFSLVQPESFLI